MADQLTLATLWPIERRVLEYLDQRGPSHRERVVVDLASPDSQIGRRRDNRWGAVRGSNGNTPRIMGAWCRRLVKDGLVRQVRSDDTWWVYRYHEVTEAGRKLLRSEA